VLSAKPVAAEASTLAAQVRARKTCLFMKIPRSLCRLREGRHGATA
jgi:hypothetical protein